MEIDTAPATSQVDHYSDDEPLVSIMDLISTADVTGEDIMSKIDHVFSELYTSASSGPLLGAAFDALQEVRSTWKFMGENTDELTRTCFYMQLVERILHDASISGQGQTRRHALAVRELVFNLNFAYKQDQPTPLNLRVCTRTLSA